MSIELAGVVPLPLKEFVRNHPSDVWNQNLSFIIGERIFLSAPSGRGKTTLLMILYGVRKDYEGAVTYESDRIDSWSHQQWTGARRNSVSVLFQELRLFPHMTGLDNIELKNAVAGSVLRHKIEEYAVRLDVHECLHRPCRQLSLGQQQRIALIRSLMQPFTWLLLDEPFSHLDRTNADKLAALVDEECSLRNAGLLVTGFSMPDGLRCGRELRI
ncbi:MAG: ATP-binding cassette domain-containing protein [Ignavibacteriales bacterium]|nr:ATP-binding cassette domain-containing protein [Ignavibacteriales bacterium]